MTDEIPQATADHGAWGYNEDTRTLTYLVSGKGADIDDNNNPETRNIQLRVSFSGLKISLDMLKGAPNFKPAAFVTSVRLENSTHM